MNRATKFSDMRHATTLGLFFFFLGVPSSPADDMPERLRVTTWNLEWFFDHYTGDNGSELAKKLSAPSREEWEWKLQGVADAIASIRPDILALQEVESKRVLWKLKDAIRQRHGLDYLMAFVEGFDRYTEQDVAVLALSGLVAYGRREQTREMFASGRYHGVQKHLFVEFEWGPAAGRERLTLLDLHLRAMPEGAPIRQRQARLIRHWVQDRIARGENLVVLGDINTEELHPTTPVESELGILRGLSETSPEGNLIDLHQFLEPKGRSTHLLQKQFDRILVSRPLIDDAPDRKDLVFVKARVAGEACIRGAGQDKSHRNIFHEIPQDQRDLSDHLPVVAEFEFR